MPPTDSEMRSTYQVVKSLLVAAFNFLLSTMCVPASYRLTSVLQLTNGTTSRTVLRMPVFRYGVRKTKTRSYQTL